MKKLFEAADRYIQSSDWKVISVLKFCLISLGMIVGMLIKPEHKKVTMVCAIAVFMASYIPLMNRFFFVFTETEQDTD